MNLNEAFAELLNANEPKNDEIEKSVKALVDKLDSVYYCSNCGCHYVISGSYGRGTATKNSDIDVCYILPNEDYDRFCCRKGNIQSQLLSEIKNHLDERYPNSIIKGDGQVVDALFKKTVIELVPSFQIYTSSSTLTYPNTHDDGSWLKTNPLEQQRIINDFAKEYSVYRSLCKLIRCWRDEHNIRFKGIEIDLLVHDFLSQNSCEYRNVKIRSINFISLLISFFDYLQAQRMRYLSVIGDDDIKNIDLNLLGKAPQKAKNKLLEQNMGILWDNCIDLFGDGFPSNPYYSGSGNYNEQFIQDLFQVRIRNKVEINCDISANGFRTRKLNDLLKSTTPLNHFIVQRFKSLDFYIEYCDVEKPYDIYWKVRNVGEEARKRDDIRGAIVKGEEKHHESSQFHGPHYVECYIVKENVCVAKSRISVPIE